MKKSERLLRRMKKVGRMTRLEMIRYLKRCEGDVYIPKYDGSAYNSILYGTNKVEGILKTFCKKNLDGTYSVVKKIQAPYTPAKTAVRVFDDVNIDY